ncbi:uncharacterized protein [Lolium perenne]|uniref:uncharacterized protein n=1 Tax=Lolium perenne TaxID=4522 RepID=UPI0021EB2C65|nr:uncharacterized protein LOC127342142 [Lolium perenne]
MSCSSSPRDADVDERRRHGGRGKNQEEVPALDLLDDFWFFSNSLGGRDDGKQGGTRRPPLLPKSPSTSSSGRAKTGASDDQLQMQGRKSRFLRTPSLPSPRIRMDPPPSSSRHVEEVPEEDTTAGADQAAPAEAAEDDDMNWSKIYEGVLRTRIAEEGRGSGSSSPLLHRAPSTPVPYSAMMGVDGRGRGEEAVTRSTPSLPRLRHSHSTLENHCRSHTPTKPDRDHRTPRLASISSSRPERGHPRRDLRSFGASQHPGTIARTKSEFLDKRWKSSSALESIEVQGFKDLGFVFDQEELRESLADVLPGLKTRGSSNSGSGSASDNDDANDAGQDEEVVPRPYLSEAWQDGARSAPPLTTSASAIKLQQADARSAAEMKDQLRMWAQAVACNVRQEC